MARRNLVLFLYGEPAPEQSIWEPAADVFRSGRSWMIKLDLAGVQTQDVQIASKGSALIVSGVRRDSCRDSECTFYNLEISYSYFRRSFSFPFNLDGLSVEMNYAEGMLLIKVLEPEG